MLLRLGAKLGDFHVYFVSCKQFATTLIDYVTIT